MSILQCVLQKIRDTLSGATLQTLRRCLGHILSRAYEMNSLSFGVPPSIANKTTNPTAITITGHLARRKTPLTICGRMSTSSMSSGSGRLERRFRCVLWVGSSFATRASRLLFGFIDGRILARKIKDTGLLRRNFVFVSLNDFEKLVVKLWILRNRHPLAARIVRNELFA